MGAANDTSKVGKGEPAVSLRGNRENKIPPYPNRLGQIRRACHKTQVQIAEHLGVTNKAVSSWECGTRELRAGAILGLCNYLGCTPNELLGYDKTSRIPQPDVYEEKIYTLVHGLTPEGKTIVYKVTEGISLNPRYRLRKKGRPSKRSHPE